MPTIQQVVQAPLPTPTEVAISIGLIGIGFVLLPILAYLKLVHPKGLMGRILWTLGAIALGPYMLIQRETGRYELVPARREDGDVHVQVDGDWLAIDEVPEHWSRLGKNPFAITYEKSERLFRDVLSDVGDAVPDGGLDGTRGGYHSYVPDDVAGGYTVRIHRLLERLREAGGSYLADIAEEEGLREFGGNYDMSNTILIVYVVSMLLLGMVGGLWYVS